LGTRAIGRGTKRSATFATQRTERSARFSLTELPGKNQSALNASDLTAGLYRAYLEADVCLAQDRESLRGAGRRETSGEVSLPFSGGSLSRKNARCVTGEANQPSLSDPALRQRATDNSRSTKLHRWLMDFARNHYAFMGNILYLNNTLLYGS
jgi:hypothetical protein